MEAVKEPTIVTQWCEPGRWIYEGEKKLLDLEALQSMIQALQFKEIPPGGHITAPAQQGMAIIETIKAYQLPKVSHVAISDDLEPYGMKGLYGIRCHYNDGQVELYMFDDGTTTTLIKADRHASRREKEEQIQIWISLADSIVTLLRNSSIDRKLYAAEKFGRGFFYECRTITELQRNVLKSSWMIGQTFFYKNLCLINKNKGASDWVLLRDEIIVHSFHAYDYTTDNFEAIINKILSASADELLNLFA